MYQIWGMKDYYELIVMAYPDIILINGHYNKTADCQQET